MINMNLSFLVLLLMTFFCQAADIRGTVTKLTKEGFILKTKEEEISMIFASHLVKGTTDPRNRDYDDWYRLRPRDLREGMEVLVNYGKTDDVTECWGLIPESAGIDFGGLNNIKIDYTIELKITTRGKEVFKKTYSIKAGTTSKEVAALVFKSFERPKFKADRWSVVLPPRLTGIDIDGYYKGDKFEVVDKIEAVCPELSAADQVPISQLGKPWSKPLSPSK